MIDLFVGRAVTRLPLEREVRRSNLGPVKSDTVFSRARHCSHISSKACVARVQWRGNGPRQLVTRFGVIQQVKWKIWSVTFRLYFFQFINLIVLTSRAEFTVGQNGATVVNCKLPVCLFSLWFICSKICQFVQPAWLFSSQFTRSTNMSNQISRIGVTAKNLETRANFFFNALLFFSAGLFLVY